MPSTIDEDWHANDAPTTVGFGIEAHPTGRGTLLRVGGEIDLATAPLLRMAAHSALAERPGQVHLHLGEVTFFDCTGLGVLIGLRSAALLTGAPAPRITASGPVRRLMELAGVCHLFDLDPPGTTHTARE